MTDDRNDPAGTPPEPPPPPPEPPLPPPATVAPARSRPLGWIVAALLALVLIVLVILYFMGMFDSDRRREEVPWNSAAEAPAPPPAPPEATGDPMRADPALPPPPQPQPPPAAGGQVTAQWLQGGWGQDCPAVNDPVFVFQPGGRLLFPPDSGTWTLAGNIVTVTVNGRARSSSMRWDYLDQDSARITRLRTGDVYIVHRCP